MYGANDCRQPAQSNSTPFTEDAQTPVLGDGSADSPYKVSTQVYVGSTELSLNQTDTYVIGADAYKSTVLITNSSSAAQTVTLYHAADCYLGNEDVGYGYRGRCFRRHLLHQDRQQQPRRADRGIHPSRRRQQLSGDVLRLQLAGCRHRQAATGYMRLWNL